MLAQLAAHGRTIGGVHDAWQGLNELALQFDPTIWTVEDLAGHCLDLGKEIGENVAAAAMHEPAARRHQLPITYDGDDLAAIATTTGLRQDAVIAAHQSASYTVAMIGFRPHFPYLLGLQHCIYRARAKPRPRVRAGSVAIADALCGVYPSDGPGGWHLLGHTDVDALGQLQAGDEVQFVAE